MCLLGFFVNNLVTLIGQRARRHNSRMCACICEWENMNKNLFIICQLLFSLIKNHTERKGGSELLYFLFRSNNKYFHVMLFSTIEISTYVCMYVFVCSSTMYMIMINYTRWNHHYYILGWPQFKVIYQNTEVKLSQIYIVLSEYTISTKSCMRNVKHVH